jgi:cardiolipin synthase A/B
MQLIHFSFALSGLLFVACVLLGLILWSRTHKVHTRWSALQIPQRGPQFHEMVAGLTLGATEAGNRVEVLRNGDGFFDVLLADIAQARHSVHFETYLWRTGTLTRRFATALAERARAGVDVRVLIDGEGGKEMTDDERQGLRDAGVHLGFYNPRTLRNVGTYNTRDHRKIVVLDGRLGFVGGHCFTDEWQGNAQDRRHYRDTSARVQGPIVMHLQAAFSENWTEVCGEILADEKLFPALEPVGDACAHLAYVSIGRRASSVKILHHVAIEAARESVLIQNPYFLPDEDAIGALRRAVQRGVRVRLMKPTLEASDNRLVQHACHHGLRPVLESGVEVYDYDHTLLHQKVMVIDGQWAMIGSTNFDDRSFDINDEITLSVFDETTARELTEDFEADLVHCRKVTVNEWNARGWGHRIADWAAFRLRTQL